MPALVLKIDIDTWRGTREGVPNLVRILQQHQANATFLFSLGKDHTGWALKRIFRPGFFSKVSRTSVVEHYGIKTLLYGVALPAPDIGACLEPMRAVRDAGFECGIHTWDHIPWHDHARNRGRDWTLAQMQAAEAKFRQIFGYAAPTHGAAGWQMNPHAFAYLEQMGLTYASDGRAELNQDGSLLDPSIGPYRLDIHGEAGNCLQMPTTLPTFDELLGREINGRELNQHNLAEHMLKLSATPRDHVFTLHAELEGQKLAPIFEKLLTGWRQQGYQLISMGDYYQQIKAQQFPVRALRWGAVPGRSGELILA